MINEEKENESQDENQETYPIYIVESTEELDELCSEDPTDMNPDNQIYN